MTFLEICGNAAPKYQLIPVEGNLFETLHRIKSNLKRQGYISNGDLRFDYPTRQWVGEIKFFDRHANVKTLEVTTL